MKSATTKIILIGSLSFILVAGGAIYYLKSFQQTPVKKASVPAVKIDNQNPQSNVSVKSAPGTVRLFLEPSEAVDRTGTVFPVKVQADTGKDFANILIINLSYENGLSLEPDGCKVESLFSSLPGDPGCIIDHNKQTVKLALQATAAQGPFGVFTIATLDMKDKSRENNKIIFTGPQQIYTQQEDGTTISAKVMTQDGEY